MRHTRQHSRNLFIWIEAAKGRTYADIGREYGLSRERIRQIVLQFDRDLDKGRVPLTGKTLRELRDDLA